MQENTLKELYKPFNLMARKGVGGKTFKYVPTNDIVDRMNRVFQGEWSTQLISSEIVDDQILVLVRVSVVHNGTQSSHDGYASQQIMRYTSGTNTGKIIDIGNAYRSAMSKAIKTAVARWGVGLYLEGEESTTEVPQTDMPFIPNQQTPSTTPVSIPAQAPPPTTPVVNNTPPVGPPMADIPTETPMNNVVEPPIATPVFTNTNTAPVENMAPPVADIPQTNTRENLTDVQKVAIETIMSVHNLTFVELASRALERTDNLPASLDVVSYSDAVKMIQHGNNLRPGQPS